MSTEKVITVDVTKSDIKSGLKNDVNLCPIALALERCVPGGRVLYVIHSRAAIKVKPDGEILRTLLSRRARNFISTFDDEGARGVKPSRFRFRFAPIS